MLPAISPAVISHLAMPNSGVRRYAAALQSLVSAGAGDRLARAEEPVVRRLCAGGNRIRTLGPPRTDIVWTTQSDCFPGSPPLPPTERPSATHHFFLFYRPPVRASSSRGYDLEPIRLVPLSIDTAFFRAIRRGGSARSSRRSRRCRLRKPVGIRRTKICSAGEFGAAAT